MISDLRFLSLKPQTDTDGHRRNKQSPESVLVGAGRWFPNRKSSIVSSKLILEMLVLLSVTSCRRTPNSQSPTRGTQTEPSTTGFPVPGSRNQELRTENHSLVVGRDTIYVAVAATDAMRTVGLMYRTVMAENEGMLFVFDHEITLPFWMKNTELPLSIAFIDRNGIILDLQDMTPLDEQTLHAPGVPYRFALEMNQGWFQRHAVKAGDTVRGDALSP